ncbi:pilus assembly protein CpaE [Aquipuribacter sp. MA13-13]|uniref:pilus assembly protein CpaE n=1 Tax=Aquipuribacter sp. MA13-13 TaxID=3440840 RepID=UPI003EEDA7BA
MSVRALDAAEVLPVAAGRALREAGLGWRPTAGDRFVLADRDMDAEVFVVSDMVADVHDFPSGPVIGFNGTVEWALDSVGTEQAVWLPAEDQLRRLLQGTFRRLERTQDSWAVTVHLPGDPAETVAVAGTAAEAYADALLQLLRRALT